MKLEQSKLKTNFMQTLMHLIKGNFGTGILAMPESFNHCGLLNACLGLPILCIITTYCVHLLVRSSQHLENKLKTNADAEPIEYAQLAKGSFITGPKWMRPYSEWMCKFVDAILIVSQIGICCVYLVFIVDNLKVLARNLYDFEITPQKEFIIYLSIMPVAILLSYIRTLKRLSIASACANFLQCIGISIIIEYLLRDMPSKPQIELVQPFSEVARGFGSAMFAFEGISVVMPIYSNMKRPEQMGGLCGVINVAYAILLALYVTVGLFGYLRFGSHAAASITLNLPREPIYEVVRAMFVISLFLSYPLQFYVPNEIIWNWFSGKFLLNGSGGKRQLATVDSINESHLSSIVVNHQQQQQQQQQNKQADINNATVATSAAKLQPSPISKALTKDANNNNADDDGDQLSGCSSDAARSLSTKKQHQQQQQQQLTGISQRKLLNYEYGCRTILVMFTFFLAMTVPKLNLMMEFFGSISGTALSITLPALIHLAAFWEDISGKSRLLLLLIDGLVIAFGIIASFNGSYFSFIEIIKIFSH